MPRLRSQQNVKAPSMAIRRQAAIVGGVLSRVDDELRLFRAILSIFIVVSCVLDLSADFGFEWRDK